MRPVLACSVKNVGIQDSLLCDVWIQFEQLFPESLIEYLWPGKFKATGVGRAFLAKLENEVSRVVDPQGFCLGDVDTASLLGLELALPARCLKGLVAYGHHLPIRLGHLLHLPCCTLELRKQRSKLCWEVPRRSDRECWTGDPLDLNDSRPFC